MHLLGRLRKHSHIEHESRDPLPSRLIFTTVGNNEVGSTRFSSPQSVLTPYEDFMPKREDKAWNLSVLRLTGLCTVCMSLLSISILPSHRPIIIALPRLTSRVEWDRSLHRLFHISCFAWRCRRIRQSSRLAAT